MTITDYWQLFLETGAPEAYLLYRKELEETHVPVRSGHCSSGDGLQ